MSTLARPEDAFRDPTACRWRDLPRTILVLAGLGALWLLALLVGAIVEGRRGCRRPGNAGTAAMQMQNFAAALSLYGLERRSLPSRLDDLTQPDRAEGVPYLRRIPPDPWGRPYVYRIVDAASREYEIRSHGADGRAGTGDDVVERRRAGVWP